MVTIIVDDDYVLNALMDRVAQWTEDEDVLELFRRMYQNSIDGGLFENEEFNVMSIVDNDYVNWCDVISEGEENYAEVDNFYKKNGLGDCSCNIDGIGYIEAEYNGYYLIRH